MAGQLGLKERQASRAEIDSIQTIWQSGNQTCIAAEVSILLA